MMKVRGEWVPDVNARELREAVLRALIVKPAALTGNEVRFLRLGLEKTQQTLADELGVTHPAISKWESAGDGATGMQTPTEFLLRFGALTSRRWEFQIVIDSPDGGEPTSAEYDPETLRRIFVEVRRLLRPQQEEPVPVHILYDDLAHPGVLRMRA